MNLHTNLDLTTSLSEISTQITKIGRKGRNSQCRRLEISTQTAKISQKGRESRSPRPEISTQKAKISRKGRESHSCRPGISTQTAEISLAGSYPGLVSSHPSVSSAHTPASPVHILSIVSSHILLQASLGMRRSPLGEMATEPTLGPSGRQERLNCWLKKRR